MSDVEAREAVWRSLATAECVRELGIYMNTRDTHIDRVLSDSGRQRHINDLAHTVHYRGRDSVEETALFSRQLIAILVLAH